MPKLENNITTLKMRIASACLAAGRDSDSVQLLAVSKTRNTDTLKRAYELGLRQFGENYASEAQQKIPILPKDIQWHFIGPIQSNKTRFIAENFTWVHSLDREKIIQRLNDQRPASQPPLQCLLQINISNEAQKAGISPENAPRLAQLIANSPNLNFRGLMAIPAIPEDKQALQEDFVRMATLLEQLKSIDTRVDTLSMGMSQDLEEAVNAGSTIVRIGTDLFGARTANTTA